MIHPGKPRLISQHFTYTVAGTTGSFSKSRLRYTTIHPGEGDRYEEQLEKIIAVYKQKKYAANYNVWWRFGASAGHHVAVEPNFDKWSYFDTANSFVTDFESIHGAGSYDRFIEELDIRTDRSKTYDELIEHMPNLSSNCWRESMRSMDFPACRQAGKIHFPSFALSLLTPTSISSICISLESSASDCRQQCCTTLIICAPVRSCCAAS